MISYNFGGFADRFTGRFADRFTDRFTDIFTDRFTDRFWDFMDLQWKSMNFNDFLPFWRIY